MEHVSTRTFSEMDVAFVLRNILEVPEVQLEGYLKHLGDPLEGLSMELCGKCEETVAKAKQVYKEMMDVQRRFKKVKFEVISKIMSIQQGIKCGDKKKGPEDGSESIDCGGGTNLDNLEDPGAVVNELTWRQIVLEESEWTEEGGLVDNYENQEHEVHDQQVPSAAEALSSGNNNLLEFHYHVKTEEQLSGSGDVEVVATTAGNSSMLKQYVLTAPDSEQALTKERPMSKTRYLAIPKNPKAAHGLVTKGLNRLPKGHEGPVQCKCGKQYIKYNIVYYSNMLRKPLKVLRTYYAAKSASNNNLAS